MTMIGKARCAQLKKIRQEIARRNDIHLEIKACDYEGDCAGTCPACDAEVRYLEDMLERRRAAGLPIELKDIIILSGSLESMQFLNDQTIKWLSDLSARVEDFVVDIAGGISSTDLMGEGSTPDFF